MRNTNRAPMRVPCAGWAENLAASHTGDLSPAEHAALNAHIEACPACSAARSEYREMDALIRGLPAVAPLAELPLQIRQALEQLNGSEHPLNTAASQKAAISLPAIPRPSPALAAPQLNARKQRLISLASTLAAVLVVGAILAGFLLLVNGHRSFVGEPAPTSAGSVMYVASERDDGTLYAVRPSDGAFFWQHSTGHKLTGTLAVSKDAIVTGSNGWIYALRKTDGSLLWQKSIRGGAFPPMLTDGKAVYFSAANTFYALRSSDGAQLWHYSTPVCDNCLNAIVAVAQDTVYGFSSAGLYALRSSDGKLRWFDQGFRFTTRSFAVLNGKVYVPAEMEGRVYVLRARDGSVLWHWHRPDIAAISSQLQAVGGQVYFTADGLYALRASDGKQLWVTLQGNQLTDPVTG